MSNLITDRDREIGLRETILPGAPWVIAHKSMLEVNKPYKFIFNNQDYVIWQNDRGEVLALNNICPHMQAKLSNGWICAKTKAITCPFHGLKFDGAGKLDGTEKVEGETLVQPLKLIVRGDLIWTYGNHQPKLPIPELITDLTVGYQFLGIAGERSIKAPFLNCLKINYDFNHAIATHRQPFKFDKIIVNNYQENGYYTQLDQEIIRSENSWQELISNPALLTVPKTLCNHFEYAFPCITSVSSQTFLGKLQQFFILYPETETITKTFVLVYLKPKNKLARLLSSLVTSYFLKSFDLVIEQDSGILESVYPSQKPKIRLPREEIMFHVAQLYNRWNDNNNGSL